MDDWRTETAADLEYARGKLRKTLDEISGEPTADQVHSIWTAYIRLEKSVVFVKLELELENPGVFVNPKPYKVPDERQAISFALRSLDGGIAKFSSGDLAGSLPELRDARNYIRVLLRDLRRRRLKRARSARVA